MAVSLLVESWLRYGFAVIILILRMASRSVSYGGASRLKIEDLLMLVAVAFYTAEIIFMNIVASAQSNLLPPGYLEHHVLTHAEILRRAYGSKITLVVEQCQCATVWILKICILIIYWRLTRISYPKHNKAVIALGIYVIGTFIIMESLYFGAWCQPFPEYWAVPTSNPEQCAAALHHLITNMVFNLTSDMAIIGIAVSLLVSFNFARTNKYALMGLTLLGVFVVACAIANKSYSFSNPYGSQWTRWYIRESSTALLVANLPFVWSLAMHLKKTWKKRRNRANGISDENDNQATDNENNMENGNTDRRPSTMPLNGKIPEFATPTSTFKRSKLSDFGRGRRNSVVLGKQDQLAYELENWEQQPERSSLTLHSEKPGESSNFSDRRKSGYSDLAASPTSPTNQDQAPPPYPTRPTPTRPARMSRAQLRAASHRRGDSPPPGMVDGEDFRLAIAHMANHQMWQRYGPIPPPPPESPEERARFLNPRPTPPIPIASPAVRPDTPRGPQSQAGAADPFTSPRTTTALPRLQLAPVTVHQVLASEPGVFSTFSTETSEETQAGAEEDTEPFPEYDYSLDLDVPYSFPRAEDPNSNWYKAESSSSSS